MKTLFMHARSWALAAAGVSLALSISCSGADGKNGAAGEQGLAGIDGSDGRTGKDGGDGKDGLDGSDGSQGPTGQDGTGCTVASNGDGTSTITCADGSSVTVSDGLPGLKAAVTDFHGTDYLLTIGEYADGHKSLVDVTITSAVADVDGKLTVNFSVADKTTGDPVDYVSSVNGSVAKLVAPTTGEASTKWVPYVWTSATAGSGAWNNPPWSTPATTVVYQGNSDRTGTLTNQGGGNYTYVFAKNLATATNNGVLVGYDRALKHRVVIRMGGHSGPTGDASFDFVPSGGTVSLTRDIVQTTTCYECHGETQFKAHGGDRLAVDDCVTCHVPNSKDPQSGESLDMKVMIHKIHAGGELQSIPGADGIVWDDPATVTDESADNGQYAIWGYGNSKHEWWKVGFPAIINNCTKCHQGGGADVDNWKTKPSRAACGSCHDKVNFATGANHTGGVQTDDQLCDNCHQPANNGVGYSVSKAHDFTQTDESLASQYPLFDIRSVPEFSVALTVSTPANGSYFVAGEAPAVYMTLTDAQTGSVIDHTTMLEDSAAESCTQVLCVARDGKFRGAALFVHGPRHANKPVLTTAARAAIFSSGAGPWDIGLSGTFTVRTDGGAEYVYYDTSGGDKLALGEFALSFTWGTFWPVTTSAVTPTALMTWMNAQSAFKLRAIAYLEGTKLAIRSRNFGKVQSIQLLGTTPASPITQVVFGNDTTAKMGGGFTPSNDMRVRSNPANNDPKVTWTTGYVKYQLDPVDDIEAGTYIANVEIADRGNTSDTNFRTPSIARTTFQVKTASQDKLISGNCGSCHQNGFSDPGEGDGFIVDARRHNKRLNVSAPDQCTACHDEQPQSGTGTAFSGAKPISKRVHAIHNGANLNYPLLTVDYSNGDSVKGRNWEINFPQDVRNCQACHADGLTSGSWATKPARLACSGCHDSDAATAHMKAMTYDPTPLDAYSGDEKESCTICH